MLNNEVQYKEKLSILRDKRTKKQGNKETAKKL